MTISLSFFNYFNATRSNIGNLVLSCLGIMLEAKRRHLDLGGNRSVSLQKNIHKKENGQIPFPTDKAFNDADKMKTGPYRDKKAVIKKGKGQIPFPTDRALNDADRVKRGMYRDEKKQMYKKKKMMAYSSSPTHTTCTLTVPI